MALPWFNGCCVTVESCTCPDVVPEKLTISFHVKIRRGDTCTGGGPTDDDCCGVFWEGDVSLRLTHSMFAETGCVWRVDWDSYSPDDQDGDNYVIVERLEIDCPDEGDTPPCYLNVVFSRSTVVEQKFNEDGSCFWGLGIVYLGDDDSGFGDRCFTRFTKDFDDGDPVGEYERVDVGPDCTNEQISGSICPLYYFEDSITNVSVEVTP